MAKERDAQAVVVGTQRRLGLRDIILGSTARGVIKNATSPSSSYARTGKAKPDAR